MHESPNARIHPCFSLESPLTHEFTHALVSKVLTHEFTHALVSKVLTHEFTHALVSKVLTHEFTPCFSLESPNA
jgi:hypothetical protein